MKTKTKNKTKKNHKKGRTYTLRRKTMKGRPKNNIHLKNFIKSAKLQTKREINHRRFLQNAAYVYYHNHVRVPPKSPPPYISPYAL